VLYDYPSGGAPAQATMTNEATWNFKYSIDNIGTISNESGSKGHFEATTVGSNTVQCLIPAANGSFNAGSTTVTVTN
ncbi:MAG: hypothetical protein HRT50_15975, partial [Colwellia sp.]|uniref:hypothetical protein n=1 Tax=Colwellia sp. TaxID=56799 RepID=UPI001DE0BCB3